MNEATCRSIVRQRAEDRCERCGKNWPPATLHHRRKRSSLPKSRMWEVENCCALCGHGTSRDGCHSFVEANPRDAESEGWHCRPWHEPADIPVLYRGQWALLTVDGGVDFESGRELAASCGFIRGGAASEVPAQVETE